MVRKMEDEWEEVVRREETVLLGDADEEREGRKEVYRLFTLISSGFAVMKHLL